MGGKGGIVVSLAIAAVLAILVAGCGGGSSTGSDQEEGNASFIVKGQKNTIVKFGEEADSDEREAASDVLEENLEARAAADWAGQCATLSAAAIKPIEEQWESKFKGIEGCAASLKREGEPASATAKARRNTLTDPVAALRVKGKKAYALYHGSGGKNYAMAMELEGDEWKVSSLTTVELPKAKS